MHTAQIKINKAQMTLISKTLIFFDLSHISARNICRNIAIKDEAANKYPALEALNPLSFKV